jgi:hypothetical protein
MRPIGTFAVILLVAVALAAAGSWWNQRRLARVDGSFRCKVRAVHAPSGLWPHLRRRWPRRRTWARWSGDILVARKGLLYTRTVALAVKPADDGVRGAPAYEVRRCGRCPLVMELVLPDGSRVQMAAPDSARIAMVGPFLAAAVHALPRAPIGKGQRGRQGR